MGEEKNSSTLLARLTARNIGVLERNDVKCGHLPRQMKEYAATARQQAQLEMGGAQERRTISSTGTTRFRAGLCLPARMICNASTAALACPAVS